MTLVDPSLAPLPAPQPLRAALDSALSARRTEAFDAALARQGVEVAAAEPTTMVDAAQPVAAPQIVAGPEAVVEPGAVDRARRTLALEPVQGTAPGDAIVDGLRNLRGAFDGMEKHIDGVIRSGPLDANALIEVQMEVVRFSLLTDVTSKLSGKSTQVLDTLMKGQ